MCGLQLDVIAAELTAQKPSAKMAELFKRQRRMQMLGVASLSIAAIIGFSLVLGQAVFYKLMILGPELLFGSAIGALILFMLASVFFFNYPKLFMKPDRSNPHSGEQAASATPTNKLLNDPPFQPASVTEHSTELIGRKS
jgi:formate hydrogenlyase subunit 3/multisubunit Na+/H+ antiporter MnhD subunit